MSRLLDVAAAEHIFHWYYLGPQSDGMNWQHCGHRRRLQSWVFDTHNALYVVEFMKAQYNLRATLESPLRVDGPWTVHFRNWKTEEVYSWTAPTMEEAVVRAALLARGVIVDD